MFNFRDSSKPLQWYQIQRTIPRDNSRLIPHLDSSLDLHPGYFYEWLGLEKSKSTTTPPCSNINRPIRASLKTYFERTLPGSDFSRDQLSRLRSSESALSALEFTGRDYDSNSKYVATVDKMYDAYISDDADLEPTFVKQVKLSFRQPLQPAKSRCFSSSDLGRLKILDR